MSDSIAQVVAQWMDDWIIKENLCPFAKPVRVKDKVRIAVCRSGSWSDIYAELRRECELLKETPELSTTLLAISHGVDDFYDYLSLLDGAHALLAQEGWEGVFQLASFHPDYLFEGEDVDSFTHYSNRSPIPILHILRESEISRAIPGQDEADDIVQRNQQHLHAIGIEEIKRKLAQWQQQLSANG